MLLSSGVIWRYRTLEEFRAECPAGDPELQRTIIEQLDDALEWLESLGATVIERETGNPRTIGMRFDTRRLTETLVRVIGDSSVRLLERGQTPLKEADILSTGGFTGRLARERGLPLRANPWSEGDGLDAARRQGAATAGNLDEFYGRALPAGVDGRGRGFRASLAALRALRGGRLRRRFGAIRGRPRLVGDPSRAGDRRLARRSRVVPRSRGPPRRARSRSNRRRDDRSGKSGRRSRQAEPPFTSVLVQASVTQTLGGLRIDERARVVGAQDLHAAGADVGGYLDRRVLERARGCARLRPDRRRRRRSARRRQQIGARPPILRQRRRADPVHDPAPLALELDDDSRPAAARPRGRGARSPSASRRKGSAWSGGHETESSAPSTLLALDSIRRKDDAHDRPAVVPRIDGHASAE